MLGMQVVLRELVNDETVVYLFCADTEEEREEWIDSLKLTILQEVAQTPKAANLRKSVVSDEDAAAQMKAVFAAFDSVWFCSTSIYSRRPPPLTRAACRVSPTAAC